MHSKGEGRKAGDFSFSGCLRIYKEHVLQVSPSILFMFHIEAIMNDGFVYVFVFQITESTSVDYYKNQV